MVVSFAVVWAAYWLYGLIVVPWIEPSVQFQAGPAPEELFQQSDQEQQFLQLLFPPGAWELDQPKIFESQQTKLLFQHYSKQSPNILQLRPCTLLFFPEEAELPPEERYRRAVVMEVPEGAILEFDQPLDLTQGRMGHLVRGQLQGTVRIRSQGGSPGPEDDLRITTREVHLTPKEITTSEKVEVYWGRHFARGQDLRIQLGERKESSAVSLGGLKTLELRRVELVHMEVPPEATQSLPGMGVGISESTALGGKAKVSSPVSRSPGGSAPSGEPGPRGSEPHQAARSRPRADPASSSAGDRPSEQTLPGQQLLAADPQGGAGIAEITCRGPFRFDAKRWEASFADQVVVRYQRPNGPTDQLRCDRLVVVFQPKPVSGVEKGSLGVRRLGGGNSEPPSGKKVSIPVGKSSPRGDRPGGRPLVNINTTEPSPPPQAPPPEGKSLPTKPAIQDASSSMRLVLQRMEATGEVVILEAPSRQTRAVGQRLEYHLGSGRTVLESRQEAWISHREHELHAQKLDYTPGPGGRLGQGVAEGSGWLRAQTDPRTGQTVQARWSQSLQLRPHQGQTVLSLLGQAEVTHTALGRLRAEQIHLWIHQQPVGADPAGPQVLDPDRLLAEGQVELQHPQLTAWVDRLEVWFERMRPGAAGRSLPFVPSSLGERLRPGKGMLQGWRGMLHFSSSRAWWQLLREASWSVSKRGSAQGRSARPTAWSEDLAEPPPKTPAAGWAPPLGLQQAEDSAQEPVRQHFEVRSTLLRAKIVLLGRQTELKELMLEGDVALRETQTVQPGQKPLVVSGQQIHVVDAARPYSALTVQGQPAHVEARGLGLNGPKINLHRGINRLWIDGAGWMSLPMERDLQGRPTGRPEQVDIHWQHRMDFDGRSVQFEESVLATSRSWQLRTDSLEVQLREPVVFAAAKPAPKPQLHRLICRSPVLLENRCWDAQGEVSRDDVEVADLTVDLITGDLIASGPGIFRSVRRTRKKTDQKAESPKGHSSQGKRIPFMSGLSGPEGSSAGLMFLSIEFQRNLTGNFHRREMTFMDRVRTIYGPVGGWEEQIRWSQLATQPAQVIFLSCDQLSAVEFTLPPSGQRFLELVAVGNTVIESAGYTARAHRLSYTEHKGLVVLEGDGRTDAELFRQQRLGSPRERVAARKIYYWPQTNHLTLESASGLEVLQPDRKP